ncbi:hypothetical protein, partial [Listeria monocytogenes]|uniref:hypothetical protein n=1 Tax=Listeria monocytogenes TaxID=1639 RepID=UPI001A7E1643
KFFSFFGRLHYISVIIKHEHTPFQVPELASRIWPWMLVQDPAIRFFLHGWPKAIHGFQVQF